MPGTAPTYNNYNNVTDAVTTQRFMDGYLDDTIKNNVLLNILKSKGRITTEASGKWLERNARIGRHASARRTDLQERTWTSPQQYITYSFPYSFTENRAAIGEQQLMFNSGKEALVRIKNELMKTQGMDLKQDLITDLLMTNAGPQTVGGIAATAGSPVPIWGLPTIFGYGAAAQNYNPDTQTTSGAVAAGDKEVLPNVTYGNISTHPTSAISGVDNKANESTSPVIGNYTSTAWTGTATWKANSFEVMNHMCERGTRTNDGDGTPDLMVMSRGMYTEFSNRYINSYRIELGSKPTDANVKPLSGQQITYGNGITVTWDPNLTANILYVLNTSKLELCLFPQKKLRLDQGELVETEDTSMFNVRTDYLISQGAYVSAVSYAGQLIADPRFQGMAYAAA